MNSKRRQSPQAGTPGKKPKGNYNPRDEAVAPTRNPPFKTKPAGASKASADHSDSESEARDRAYHESVKAQEINFDFELALDEDNIKEALAMATTDEQRERARKAAEYIEQVSGPTCRQNQSNRHSISHLNQHTNYKLQVRSRRNCLTDPKNKPVISFFKSTPRLKAAARSAQAYSAQVSKSSKTRPTACTQILIMHTSLSLSAPS